MSLETHQFEFGEFVLDAREKGLWRHGKSRPITPKIFELLLVLVENQGHLVEKKALMEKVWPDSFVEESNLTFSIRQLRKILGDDKLNPKFIETVPRRGYRFIAEVEESLFRNGAGNNGESKYELSETKIFATGWKRRPVFYLGFLALAVVSILSAGFFAWRGASAGFSVFSPSNFSGNSELTFEPVINASLSLLAAVSLDGRYVAYVNTAGGEPSIWIRQLSSGVNTQVVPPARDVGFLGIEFSPDSEKICYVRLHDQKMSLDCVSIFGGNAQQNIVSDLQGWFGISRDGSKISYIIHKDYQGNLFVADADGANRRPIYTTPNLNSITDNAFSPDGKTIAFASGQSNTASRDFGVYLIDVSGGNLRQATDFKWAHVRGVLWLPDQSGLLVAATENPAGASQLWKISFPGGEVTAVTKTMGSFSSISASADLKQILLTQTSVTSTLYLAPMSKPDDIRPVVQASMAGWTNGDILYASDSSGNRDIWRLNIDESKQTQLTVGSAVDSFATAAPDGRSIVFVSNRTGKNGIWRMNSDGTDQVLLTNAEGESDPVFTPDGRFVVYNSLNDLSLWKVPAEGGEKIKMPVENAHLVSISPDGKKFAHIRRQPGKPTLLIRDFDSCEILNEFEMPAGHLLSALKTIWTPDGMGVIYAVKDLKAAANLWLQPLNGGPPQQMTNYNSEEIFDLDISPNGEQIALIRGWWKHDAVMLKGFR